MYFICMYIIIIWLYNYTYVLWNIGFITSIYPRTLQTTIALVQPHGWVEPVLTVAQKQVVLSLQSHTSTRPAPEEKNPAVFSCRSSWARHIVWPVWVNQCVWLYHSYGNCEYIRDYGRRKSMRTTLGWY